MQTSHALHVGDARALTMLQASAVQLVLTSPPYPMVGMWDGAFRAMSPEAAEALDAGDGQGAFEAMHRCLDAVWAEAARALSPGGFLVVNIGDATRSIGGEFQLFHNHVRVVNAMRALGLTVLPDVLWRKPTNAPNKFMGSGMLPAGAYVTYEHEYILIFRKGGKRSFASAADKARRAASAYFWAERNLWFSDVWTQLSGARQRVAADRARSAAFPIELPYRLICMYSCYGDVVLDPFAGTGTTLAAALAAGRSSVGVELDPSFAPRVREALEAAVPEGRSRAARRLAAQRAFAEARVAAGKELKHNNEQHGILVMTSQERALELRAPTGLSEGPPLCFLAEHAPAPG